jgi:crossover junction endodeoxyribonuclease RuvC
MVQTSKVLGIDPGNYITGYGVVEKQKRNLHHVIHGEIKPAKTSSRSSSLATIYYQLLKVIEQSAPDVIAIEDIFYGKNVKSLIRQGEVRGVVILAASQSKLPIYEYSPLQVKKAVVGYGRADKNQVQRMVRAILKLDQIPPEDAADALAVAICHANYGSFEQLQK